MTKYIETLLAGEEVVWKTLGEVFDIRNGYTPSKSNAEFWEGGTIPWFRMEDIRLNGGILFDSIQHITPQAVKRSGLFKAGSIIMATTATIGEHALLIADSLANQQFTNFSIRKSLRENVLPKYVYYYFFILDEWCKQNVQVGSFPSVDLEQLKKQTIPIPPLRVQRKIVEVLDNFTELTARRKQYEYYRNELLSFNNVNAKGGISNVKFLPLGELGVFQRGKRFVKSDIRHSGIPCIHYGEMYTYYGVWAKQSKSYLSKELVELKNLRLAQKNDVILVGAGESEADLGQGVAWLGEENIAIHDACFLYRSGLLPKFVAHYTRTDLFKTQLRKNITSSKISAINAKALGQVCIPVPPIEEQKRIVEILDQFDTLTQSITEGLPREIELCRKQYEYYREQLLSFN